MKHKKGTFTWAVAMMKEGKKVKRSAWNSLRYIRYIYFNNRILLTSDESERTFYLKDFEAIDWEIYETYKIN